MRIGELAKAAAVSRDTLRFYEQRGLIVAQRSANGYRHYPAETLQLVQFIKVAQRLGFTLNEVGSNVAELWRAPAPDVAIALLLQEKLALIDARITELSELRSELHQRLGQQCPLQH
ncbi:MerR family transcriptional regulator [Pseudomonas syringae]|uniref:MerR family transcriptional regulator n=1 Tax=Pseudomonas TaxID=286 RepID=UPI000CD37B07|nr:MerR family transcriptional regulator [Pseudomonas syringae]MCF5200135.1 MerR family transcriptional regulator [Pseudomonas syringae]MCF5209138.1 MerR family transcriptional regulator [Pseudomonas syringae]MCF5215819.1 MerR family transcriptional regulator [Pseudomonas syringae]MCF5220834.1 MerR family transcriptional regulator [Pseudomonas syringae]MCF5266511.1 MerR family transcriptional regulator [Pseudomonas syringae]